ncbi:MAG TPA: hypothetical protein VLD63_15075 [Anaerolineales bacterium]|nr:hypothetical protein [Anaerolineales bacterium]
MALGPATLKPVGRDERRWSLAFGLAVAVVTTLPYVWAFFRQGDAWRFSGFVFGVEDGNSYLAKMLEGSFGAWLFRTPYTTMPQSGILAFIPYLLLGKLASGAALHEQLVVLYHAARFVAIPWATWATYDFASRFLAQVGWRRWATILSTLGGGLGWIAVVLGRGAILGSLPLEFYSPESFGFLAYLGLPHLVAGRALLLSSLGWYLDAVDAARSGWWAGGGLLVLGLFQPLAVASAWVVMGVHVALLALTGRSNGPAAARGALRAAAMAYLLSSPVVIYFGWLSYADPFVRAWNAQNIITSPHPIHYVLAYGLMAAVAVAGVLRTRLDSRLLLLGGWLLALPFLAYAPVNLQRRLPDGIWAAVVVLAAWGLAALHPRTSRIVGYAVAAASLPSCLILLAGSLGTANRPELPAFVPSETAQAFEELSSLATPDDAVMASFDTGNLLPAWAPVRVPIGHGPESVGFAQARADVETFYASDTPASVREDLLHRYGIRFVVYGPSERMLGSWDIAALPGLSPLVDLPDVRIYAVPGGAP